jgi:uncharacterized protein (DUF2237 family)
VPDRNVLGGPLELCGTEPMTGFHRDGCCTTGPQDLGSHTICAVVTEEFLAHQQRIGNDLSTPMPHYAFPGLAPGDRWCVTAANWLRAHRDGAAAYVVLASTHAARAGPRAARGAPRARRGRARRSRLPSEADPPAVRRAGRRPPVARRLAGPGDRVPRLDLVAVVPVALGEVGEPHPHVPVLGLPDVDELVDDEPVGDLVERALDDDERPELVAVEAPEARDPEQPRPVQDPDATRVDGPRIEREPVQALLRAPDGRPLGGRGRRPEPAASCRTRSVTSLGMPR